MTRGVRQRPYGKGRVFEWRGTWYIDYRGPKGAGAWGQIRESAGKGASREDAEALLGKRLHEVENHRVGLKTFVGPAAQRVTVGKLLDDLFEDYATRELRSIRPATSHANQLREHLEQTKAHKVTAAVLQKYVRTRRADGAADATIDRELEILRRAFGLAKDARLVAEVPRIPRLLRPHQNARRGFLDVDRFAKLLAAVEDLDFRDFLEWLGITGMRPGEAASLSWASLDREGGTLRLEPKDAKIGRGRTVPLVGDLAVLIERRKSRRRLDCPLIFHSAGESFVHSRGGLVDRHYDEWFRACRRIGLPGREAPKEKRLIPYDLRRSAIRNLRDAGVPEQVAMTISGHVTRSTFDRYGIVDDRDIRGAFAALMENRSRKRSTKGGA